jgi:NADPH:quinone reductase-like Zn-dependent oxidoreductase
VVLTYSLSVYQDRQESRHDYVCATRVWHSDGVLQSLFLSSYPLASEHRFNYRAGTVLNVLKPEYDSAIGVWGLGSVGLSSIMAAKYAGVKIIVAVDVVDSRLDIAKSFGATHTINGKDPDVKEQIANITGGDMLDFVVEATGVQNCLALANDCLGRYGVHAQLGAFKPGATPNIDVGFFCNCSRYRSVSKMCSYLRTQISVLMNFQKTFKGISKSMSFSCFTSYNSEGRSFGLSRRRFVSSGVHS